MESQGKQVSKAIAERQALMDGLKAAGVKLREGKRVPIEMGIPNGWGYAWKPFSLATAKAYLDSLPKPSPKLDIVNATLKEIGNDEDGPIEI